MACALCLKDKPLRNSHILPEFLYRPGYDEKGRLLNLKKGVPGARFVQKGLREELLCDDCETRFSRYEKYFSQVWYRKRQIPEKVREQVVVIEGLDYTKFKLFLLSVLWRAGVSKRSEFANVRLGPHQERLRAMLLAENPGGERDYRAVGSLLLNPRDKTVVDGTIMSPVSRRIGGHRTHLFVFGGCAWHFIVSGHGALAVDPLAITKEGRLGLLVFDLNEFSLIDSFMRSHVRLPARP